MQVNFKSIEVDGIESYDFPDFCDAYATYAEFENGQPLTDEQLDKFNDEARDIIHERVFDLLY
jgi:hypothetical protein